MRKSSMTIILNVLSLEWWLFGSQQIQINKMKVHPCSYPSLIIVGWIHLFFIYSKYLFSASSVSALIFNHRDTEGRHRHALTKMLITALITHFDNYSLCVCLPLDLRFYESKICVLSIIDSSTCHTIQLIIAFNF